MSLRNTASYWIGRFVLGLLMLVVAGVGPLHPAMRVILGLWGFTIAMRSVTPLIRFATLQSRMHTAWSDAAATTFARASLPRRIFYLLAAVAEADGPMSELEQQTVRHFLLDRFLDPVHADELRAWEAQPLPIKDRVGLAARIAASLDESELDSLFCWCCLVAFADGRYAEHEHSALQDVAKGLGIAPARARMLFHLARAQFLRGQKHGEPARPQTSVDVRAQALLVLGLPDGASPDQIRRRHRELVRRFHPDAQPNLGPVALREATERFTEIQRAYETLSP